MYYILRQQKLGTERNREKLGAGAIPLYVFGWNLEHGILWLTIGIDMYLYIDTYRTSSDLLVPG